MKIRIWLILALLNLQLGCAPGYYEKGPSYQEETSSDYRKWYRNPETEEEYQERIWRESLGG